MPQKVASAVTLNLEAVASVPQFLPSGRQGSLTAAKPKQPIPHTPPEQSIFLSTLPTIFHLALFPETCPYESFTYVWVFSSIKCGLWPIQTPRLHPEQLCYCSRESPPEGSESTRHHNHNLPPVEFQVQGLSKLRLIYYHLSDTQVRTYCSLVTDEKMKVRED